MARPTEVKAVVALLEQPAESVTELAKAIIATVDEARQDRTDYVVVRQLNGLADGFGPYATYAQAAKAIEGNKIPAIDGTRFFALPVRSPHQAEQAFAQADTDPNPQATRMWEIARRGGQKARSHSRKNRKR